MFDRTAFLASFDARLETLAAAEQITKLELRELSRDILNIVYETEDLAFVNRLLDVLTRMNRRTAELYFYAFIGAHTEGTIGEGAARFLSKDKKRWDKKKEEGLKQLEDPHFNIWSWSDREIKVEAKPFDLAKVTTFAKQALKKAEEAGMNKGDVFKAFMAGGFDAEELVAILGAMVDGQA